VALVVVVNERVVNVHDLDLVFSDEFLRDDGLMLESIYREVLHVDRLISVVNQAND
jgi:hypothetical protein